MNRTELLQLVYGWVFADPDLLSDVNKVAMQAIKDRLDEEQKLRAQAETALVICYDSAKRYISSLQKSVVIEALKHTALIQGTSFQQNLRHEEEK